MELSILEAEEESIEDISIYTLTKENDKEFERETEAKLSTSSFCAFTDAILLCRVC